MKNGMQRLYSELELRWFTAGGRAADAYLSAVVGFAGISSLGERQMKRSLPTLAASATWRTLPASVWVNPHRPHAWFVAIVMLMCSSSLANVIPFSDTDDLFVFQNSNGRESILRYNVGSGHISEFITEADIVAHVGGTDVDFDRAGIAFDLVGNLYVAIPAGSAGNVVLKISPIGSITTLATEAQALAAGGGTNTAWSPQGLAILSDGDVLVVDSDSPDSAIYRIDAQSGTVSVFVSEADVEALAEVVDEIETFEDVVVGPGDEVFFITEGAGGTADGVFRVNSMGVVSTVVNNNVNLDNPGFITRAANGDLFVSNESGGASAVDDILRVTTAGVVTTAISETSALLLTGDTDWDPAGLAFDTNGSLWVANSDGGSESILRFNAMLDGTGTVAFGEPELLNDTGALDWNLFGGIAFNNPEPGTLATLGLIGALTGGWQLRRRRP